MPPRRAPHSRRGRAIQPATRFGDGGELEARRFASAPVPSRPRPPVAVELGVPAFALPGGARLWAEGLHAGHKRWFKATVRDIRRHFPRIVVHYEEDEEGRTHPLALPEVRVAYLHCGQVAAMS